VTTHFVETHVVVNTDSHTVRDSSSTENRMMDSGELERERGIAILSGLQKSNRNGEVSRRRAQKRIDIYHTWTSKETCKVQEKIHGRGESSITACIMDHLRTLQREILSLDKLPKS
jgi:hypothetical protein